MSSNERSVLVVDDSAFVATMLVEMIGGIDGFRVAAVARDGEEALRLVHELAPDIVTMDIEMPGVDGLAALGYIMSEAPRPVVMVSGATTRGSVDLTIRALAEAVRDVVYPSAVLDFDTTKPDGSPQKLLDVSRLHSLGWTHRIELAEGIEGTYRWFLQHGDEVRSRSEEHRGREVVAAV